MLGVRARDIPGKFCCLTFGNALRHFSSRDTLAAENFGSYTASWRLCTLGMRCADSPVASTTRLQKLFCLGFDSLPPLLYTPTLGLVVLHSSS